MDKQATSTKHRPATALPWRHWTEHGKTIRARDWGDGVGNLVAETAWQEDPFAHAINASYIAHAANAYPALVEALRNLCNAEYDYGEIDNVAVNQAWGPAMQLLRSLGEIE